ncbi:hypothetical protein [Streptomyces tricolor]|uniref:hypothetical protein n=1 Tax=Streptomyces tricolor TaxID=68277 RepID=UPI0036ED1266
MAEHVDHDGLRVEVVQLVVGPLPVALTAAVPPAAVERERGVPGDGGAQRDLPGRRVVPGEAGDRVSGQEGAAEVRVTGDRPPGHRLRRGLEQVLLVRPDRRTAVRAGLVPGGGLGERPDRRVHRGQVLPGAPQRVVPAHRPLPHGVQVEQAAGAAAVLRRAERGEAGRVPGDGAGREEPGVAVVRRPDGIRGRGVHVGARSCAGAYGGAARGGREPPGRP